MMIKVNGEYLDFDGEVEIESQIKLFEEIETSNGDYSYSFELSKTNKNLSALGKPFPDTLKSIYQNVPCELVDDSGLSFKMGSLQVNSITDVITCTFFGGNTDWFGLLSEPMTALHLSKYDVNLTANNIELSWQKTSGIVFPILDAGALVTRSYHAFKTEDFTPLFYVKTLFKEIFNAQGIKLQGDLFLDSTFNNLTIAANAKSQNDVDDRSSYVNKTTVQNNITTSETKITFQDETTFPYFDGSAGNYNNSTYTADVKMIVKVDLNLTIDLDTAGIGATGAKIRIYKNAFEQLEYVAGGSLSSTTINTSKSINIALNAGDTVEIYALEQYGSGNIDVNSGSIRITPIYIYKVFGRSAVPNWTQGEFVSNVIRIFNVLPSFNPASKTLTLDLFNKIKDKQPIDVSDSVTIEGIDYTEFVSNYGKSNLFAYQESDDEDLRQYNVDNFIKYGAGEITVQNDFIQNSADVLETEFASPITYLNGAFDTSMERINFVELAEVDSKDISSVSDASPAARFNISNADDLFTDGDLVRIESTLPGYNGDWVVSEVTATYIEVVGLDFDASATGTVTLLSHQFTSDDNVYLFINVANVNNLFFSSLQNMRINDTSVFQSSALAYFNLLSNGREINLKYKQGLSFGSINNPASYQLSILDTYWPIFSAILNDPVMLKVSAYFNKKTYSELKSFLRPLRVKTNETNNLYYLNRITGYKSGHEPCEGELIKL